MNIMILNSYSAKIEYDPEELRKEFKLSLETFLEICREKGGSPTKDFSGKFNLRLNKELHRKITIEAESEGKSMQSVGRRHFVELN